MHETGLPAIMPRPNRACRPLFRVRTAYPPPTYGKCV